VYREEDLLQVSQPDFPFDDAQPQDVPRAYGESFNLDELHLVATTTDTPDTKRHDSLVWAARRGMIHDR
jgi:hypothetical protein